MVGWVMVNTSTGLVVPARCGRNKCSYCLPLNAMRRAQAMKWAGVDRSITLTQVADTGDPDPWPTVRYRVNKMRELLKRDGLDPGLWGTFVERGSDTGMVHCHVGQHGPRRIPKEALQDVAHRVGAGWTRVERIRQGAGFASYVGKGFASYVGKGFHEASAEENLRLNGGRLGHFSRGFFGHLEGRPVGVREAERLAQEALRPADAEPVLWAFMREVAA